MAPYETTVIEHDVQERLIEVLGSCLPEDGMDLILTDGHQFSWASDSAAYGELMEETCVLEDMISRINDGDEPALTCVDDVLLVGVRLRPTGGDDTYAMLMLPRMDYHALAKTWAFIECIFNQMQCMAGLLERQGDSAIL